MYSENCIFCKIAKGEIPCVKIWEDEKHLAFLDVNPMSPGHTLIMPKNHTDYLFDIEDNEYSELMLKAKEIAVKLKSKLNPKRVCVIVEGFLIPHAHIHLIPVNNPSEFNPKNAKPAKIEELKKIAEKILKND